MGTKSAGELEYVSKAQESGPLARPSRPVKRSRQSVSNSEMPASDSMSTLSINRLKKKIRSTVRVLDHSDQLPAGVRIEKERALLGYRQDLEQATLKKRRQLMIKKYHMVRFFERKKATRILKRLQKGLSSISVGTDEYENLERDIHNAEVDLNYVMYHPLDQKYHSLYPRETRHANKEEENRDEKKSQAERASRPAIWNVVKQCMEEGTLLALRDGTLGRRLPDATASKVMPKLGQQVSATGRGALRKEKAKSETEISPKDEKDESDGGFFEE